MADEIKKIDGKISGQLKGEDVLLAKKKYYDQIAKELKEIDKKYNDKVEIVAEETSKLIKEWKNDNSSPEAKIFEEAINYPEGRLFITKRSEDSGIKKGKNVRA